MCERVSDESKACDARLAGGNPRMSCGKHGMMLGQRLIERYMGGPCLA